MVGMRSRRTQPRWAVRHCFRHYLLPRGVDAARPAALRCLLLVVVLLHAAGSNAQPGATQVLLDFKASLPTRCRDPDPLPGWDSATPIEKWDGVSVEDGLVTSVKLSEYSLCGSLPRAWSKLTALKDLELSSNDLTGPAPPEWSNLASLRHLDLYSNALTGPAPLTWTNLTRLTKLHLSANKLTGPAPLEWTRLTSLVELLLGDNNLTGSAPPEWGSLTQLTLLDLQHNALTGRAPAEWSDLVSLQQLNLHTNHLTGSAPADWSNLASLTLLDLSSNNLTGPAPAEWSVLENIVQLLLSSNHLTGAAPAEWGVLGNLEQLNLSSNALTGTAPGEWSSLTKLRELHLSFNALTGDPPPSWSVLAALWSLDLRNNTLSGTLPPSWQHQLPYDLRGNARVAVDAVSEQLQVLLDFKLQQANCSRGGRGGINHKIVLPDWDPTLAAWTGVEVSDEGSVVSLALHGQHLCGRLPPEWSRLTELTTLGLSSNNLTGPAPPGWSKLESLRVLDLSSNKLTGSPPPEWNRLTSLTNLYLNTNGFTGTLPRNWSDLESLEQLRLHSNRLTGPAPPQWTGLTSLRHLNLSFNTLTGPLPPSWSELVRLDTLDLRNNTLTGPIPLSWQDWLPYDLRGNTQLVVEALSGQLELLRDFKLQQANCSGGREHVLPTWGDPMLGLPKAYVKDRFAFSDVAWNGVTSGDNGSIVAVHLESESLCGPLPPAWSKLTKLESLYMPYNALTGPAPPEWSTLTGLEELTLASNALTGPLPTAWSALIQLNKLRLSSNRMTGPAPPEWSNMASMVWLHLDHNAFTGTLPRSWSSLVKGMAELYLESNNWSGQLPLEWGNLTDVKLGLHAASLDPDTMPPSWNQVQVEHALAKLSVGSIPSGALPRWISNLTSLEYLNATGTSLAAELPAWLSSLTRLTTLDLSHNALTGTLPLGWGSALTHLSGALDLSHNRLNGTLPAAWAEMDGLDVLRLEGNRLTGTLPSSWSKLGQRALDSQSKASLDMSHNALRGTLPPEWSALTQLSALDLSRNSISGTLPPSWTALAKLVVLKLQGNRLGGPIPSNWTQALRRDPYDDYEADDEADDVGADINDGADDDGAANNVTTWWDGFVYVDVADNGLVGPLPRLPASVRYFNASNNSFSGTMPSIPPLLAYLHLGSNNLTGEVPAINSSTLVHLNLERNRLTKPPPALDAPSLVFLSMAGNQLAGQLPAYTHHSLVYCNLGRNSLTGTLPHAWAQRDWDFLALDHNQLGGSLPQVWAGAVGILLLQHNQLSGCLPKEWTKPGSVSIVSLSNNHGLGCGLPPSYADSGMFGSLALLDLENCSFSGTVPVPWVTGFSNGTKLWLGRQWDKSTHQPLFKFGKSWREEVCITKDLHARMDSHLEDVTVSDATMGHLRASLNSALGTLTTALRGLNITGVVFEVPQLTPQELRLGSSSQPDSPDDLCANHRAVLIVAVHWGTTATIICIMLLCYVWWVWRSAAQQRHSTAQQRHSTAQQQPQADEHGDSATSAGRDSSSNPSWLQKAKTHAAGVGKRLAGWRGVVYCFSLVMYWYDVVFDIFLLVKVWDPERELAWLLLVVLLLHNVLASFLLAWYLVKARSLVHARQHRDHHRDHDGAGVAGGPLLGVAGEADPGMTASQRPPWWGIRLLLSLCLTLLMAPFMPLVDSAMLLVMFTQHTQWMERWQPGWVRAAVDWQGLFEMRGGLEVLLEALPTAILQSTAFIIGNNPTTGWYLDTRLYIFSSVGSAVQILRFVASVLFAAAQQGVTPWRAAWNMLSYHMTDRGDMAYHVADKGDVADEGEMAAGKADAAGQQGQAAGACSSTGQAASLEEGLHKEVAKVG